MPDRRFLFRGGADFYRGWTMKKKKKPGPKPLINGTRRTYNISLNNALFVRALAEAEGVTESEIMRGLIDYVQAQYEQVGRI